MDRRLEIVLEFIMHTLQDRSGIMDVNSLIVRINRDSDPFFETSDLLIRLDQMGYVNFKYGDSTVSLSEKGYEFFNFASERYDTFIEEEEKKKIDDLEFSSKVKDFEIKGLTVENLKLKNRQLKWALVLSGVGFFIITFRKEIYQFLLSLFHKSMN